MLNRYFNNYDYKREQRLVEDLSVEAVKMYGYDIRYIPRNIVNEDLLFGEDSLSTFDDAPAVEVYVKNVDGFEGQGDLLSKFGLEIRDQITFSMPRRRFNQIKTQKILTEYGWNLLLETSNTNIAQNSEAFVLEQNEYEITSSRPLEGDLIYFPLARKLFEIKFVEHEPQYYQTGILQNYDIRCELFEYSSERIETSNTEIDAIETKYSQDVLNDNRIIVTPGSIISPFLEEELEEYLGTQIANIVLGFLLLENGSFLLQEYRIEDKDLVANNEFFAETSTEILDHSETNPFGI